MHRGDKDNVVSPFAWNRKIRNVKRLGVNGTINRTDEDFAEAVDVDVGGSKNGFVQINTRSGCVVVTSQNVDLRGCKKLRLENKQREKEDRRHPGFISTIHEKQLGGNCWFPESQTFAKICQGVSARRLRD